MSEIVIIGDPPPWWLWRIARWRVLLISITISLLVSRAQALDVTIAVSVSPGASQIHAGHSSSGNVVIWLTPVSREAQTSRPAIGQDYTLTQKEKRFTPHVLVVPTGSTVNFPNQDPFFHNVFSLFNGKRFDLGLYEAHTQRKVRFDRQGVSYIFCNIHPEMAAIIISLDTPYFGVSSADGSLAIHGVPPGRYRLSVWGENVPAESLGTLSRMVDITPQNTHFGPLYLRTSGNLMAEHKNKFGESYVPAPKDPY